ncbi:hypothetical protein DAY19_08410 [Halobacteriovorax vibrionivorans]|uniref:RES domain-containing protein n=1 Tax=Halobacteriovorax vibrionivorans TaxID=2152716 RepID=A0ABY0IFH5_9BACT|nr:MULTISPECIES: hypothetical protein [Halobacteriovorax]RZF21701.1 hypothetical protein DAY19_08410 [Halobacteriovorax vibrionivorans]TGD49006.1 hypothetical protein EP118_00630 [Halobacteriovorax sp. Y22]
MRRLKEIYSNVSKPQIKRHLKELDNIVENQGEFSKIFDKVVEIFNGIVLCRIKLSVVEKRDNPLFGIFRAREVDGSFDIKDLDSYWAKPPELQLDYGRCNTINHSVFYSSNYKLSTLLECRAKVGSEWVIAEFENIDEAFFESVLLGGFGKVFDRMWGHQGRMDSFFDHLSKSEKKKNKILYKYISSKLSEKTNSKKKYKLTSAISRFFLKDKRNSANVECIIYPSIMTKSRSLNFAIDPYVAKEKLRIVKLYHVRVLDIKENHIDIFHINNYEIK